MVTVTYPVVHSTIFKNCEEVYRLIRIGKEGEAKKLFPMEFYLVKKYVSLGLSEFKNILATRLGLQ